MTPGRGPFLQCLAAPRGRAHLREAPAQGPRVDIVEALASACPDGDCRGARATPNGERRFPAVTGSPPLRAFRSNPNRHGVLKEKTAIPDMRQSERLAPRVLIGSGMPSKCCRIIFSISGIHRCPRKGFFVMFPPSFACFASQCTVPGKKSAKKGFGDQVTHCRIVKNKTGGNHRQKPRMACSRQ